MKPYIKKQVPIGLLISIGSALIGFSMGWTAPVVEKLRSDDQVTLPSPITATQISWVGSMMHVGNLLGPLIVAYFSNVVGRKPCLILGAVLTAVAFLMVILTGSIEVIYALRAIKGLGCSIIMITNLMYLGEITSTELRGIFLSCSGVFACIGVLIIFCLGPYISYAATGYLGVLLSVAFLIGLLFIPESPIYYIMKGNDKDAQKIIDLLGRTHETDFIKSTKISIEESPNSSYLWMQLFSQKSNRKALMIVVILGVFQQLSGYIAILFYVTTIFELAGSSIRSDIATIIVGLTQLVSVSIMPFFIERSGRKPLLLISSAGSAASLAVLAVYFYLDHIGNPIVGSIGWLPLVSLVAFLLAYGGLGVVPFAFVGEMFSINTRSYGSAAKVIVTSVVGFAATTAFGYVLVYGGHFIFGFCSLSCLLAFVFTAVFVPETKGKSLTEIEAMLGR